MTSERLTGDYGKLIDSWISHTEHGVRTGGEVSDEHFWAYETMSDLCRIDPEAAWDVMRRIVNRVDDEAILACVGSGPLEDLLTQHGRDFVDRVIAEIRGNAKFADVVAAVWRNRIPIDVWDKVQAALEQRGRDKS